MLTSKDRERINERLLSFEEAQEKIKQGVKIKNLHGDANQWRLLVFEDATALLQIVSHGWGSPSLVDYLSEYDDREIEEAIVAEGLLPSPIEEEEAAELQKLKEAVELLSAASVEQITKLKGEEPEAWDDLVSISS